MKPLLLHFIERPVVILVADLDVARQRFGTPLVDKPKRPAFFEVILIPIKNLGKFGRFRAVLVSNAFRTIHEVMRQLFQL